MIYVREEARTESRYCWAMRRVALRREHDVERGPHLNLPGPVLGLGAVDVAGDLVAGAAAAAGLRA
jgi:hypothetical protein